MSAARLSYEASVGAVLRPRRPLLEIDENTALANLGRSPFKIRHNLVDHPLLTIPRLVELSRRLPEHHVRFNSGEIPIGTTLYTAPKTGLSSEETIRRIEEAKSWMVLKYVEQDSEYAELMNACLDEVQVLSEQVDPGMMRREAYIFVTSPRMLTAFHMDPENSFLLQARGSKTMFIYPQASVSDLERERYFHTGEIPAFKEENRTSAGRYPVAAGEGLHVPVTVPHWVENGPEVSISFSVTFRTYEIERRAVVCDVNAYWRSRGINPRPFGRSHLVDAAKFYGFRGLRRVRRVLGDKSLNHSGKY